MFISVQFFIESPIKGYEQRNYTYLCKRTIKVGDFVIVPTQTRNTVAKVTGVKLATPSFQCKEIIKKVRL